MNFLTFVFLFKSNEQQYPYVAEECVHELPDFCVSFQIKLAKNTQIWVRNVYTNFLTLVFLFKSIYQQYPKYC